jgi:hypothetical protein
MPDPIIPTTEVSIVPEATILPLDRPGDDPIADAQLDAILEYLEEPVESEPIDVEAETIQ